MVLLYVVLDPFKVIRRYDNYEDGFVGTNRGYCSTMHYIYTKDSCHYDSFIFGNSRSICYHEKEWRKYLPKTSVCYHYDESGGAMGHLFHEIKLVSEQSDLKNALLVLDNGFLSRTDIHGHLFELSPALQDNKGVAKFQFDYFKTFYNLAFFKRYVDYKISGQYKPYMSTYIIDKRWKLDYNPRNNELSWARQEESITRGDYYNEERMWAFQNSQFPDSVHAIAINQERLEMLHSIKNIFDAQHTDYRIVISPTYDQIKINPDDLKTLQSIFGKEFVFDFTGVNQWSSDYHCHYEIFHYRPCVANDVMKIVYEKAQ